MAEDGREERRKEGGEGGSRIFEHFLGLFKASDPARAHRVPWHGAAGRIASEGHPVTIRPTEAHRQRMPNWDIQ